MALLVPEYLQTKTYAATKDRYMWSGLGIQEGVVGATDFQVVQRAAGANMSVDVSLGTCWVQGDDATRQGLYHVVNDAAVNLTINAADATNGRIDQIVLNVLDSTDGGRASDNPSLAVLTGTPTAGLTTIAAVTANAGTGAGRAALGLTQLKLADVWVPANAASIVTADIVDRRLWARGARSIATGAVQATANNTAGPVIFNGTSSLVRLECSGAPIVATIEGVVGSSGATGGVGVMSGPTIDGAWATNAPVEADFNANYQGMASAPSAFTFTPTAGTHLFGWGVGQNNVSAAWTALLGITGRTTIIEFREDLRGTPNNGTA